jgi:hypothetical protein
LAPNGINSSLSYVIRPTLAVDYFDAAFLFMRGYKVAESDEFFMLKANQTFVKWVKCCFFRHPDNVVFSHSVSPVILFMHSMAYVCIWSAV